MAKARAKKASEAVNIMPNFSEATAKELDVVMKRKSYLEYLCFMMLQELDRKIPLQRLLEIGVSRGIVDDDAITEFFGSKDKDKDSEESGCSQAEGHTVPSLLKDWKDTTEKMMTMIRQA